MMRDALLLMTGFLLVALEAAIGSLTGLGELMPNAVLPIVIYLGMAPDMSLARAATLSFVLGMMVDSAVGSAVGLLTFVHVGTLVAARAAGVRLIMRGRVSQVLIAALAALIGAVIVIALRSIFKPEDHFGMVSIRHLVVAVLAPSLATGAIAPFVFQLARRIDTLRRRDDATSTA
ncbi:MAG: rod shape-determining protein MreD [Polyangiales bacterium]